MKRYVHTIQNETKQLHNRLQLPLVLMAKKKIQIFRSVSNERRIQCSNISSQLSHLLRYISMHIQFRLFILYILLWTIYCTCNRPNRTKKSQYEFTLWTMDSVRSIKYQFITTDTQQYQYKNKRFFAIFTIISFRSKLQSFSSKLKNSKAFIFCYLLIPSKFLLFLFIYNIWNLVFKTIYRHKLNRWNAI